MVSNPPMAPVLNLGPNFSKNECKRSFTLTNKGRRHQSLVWTSEGYALLAQKASRSLHSLPPVNVKDMKIRVRSSDYSVCS